jgi:replicative DNA helicase
MIPRNATVYLAHDADEAGDEGAAKAARLCGANSVRLRPPDGYGDWSEWGGTPAEFVEQVRAARSRKETRVQTFSELLVQYRAERGGERDPVHIGWGTIDGEIRGLSDGQVLGVAARTAVGKTWGLNSIADFLGSTSIGTLVASLEMPGVEWTERQLAISQDIAPEEVEKWAKGDIELDTTQFIKRMESVVVCDQSVDLAELPLLVNEARERLRADVRTVIIDYLGLLGVRGRDAYERTSAIGKGLKELAKAERVGVIVAMQLSRAGGDGSTEVTLEMLRDSGVLEESLDFLLGCWRPGKARELSPGERTDLKNVMRVAVLKNRKGEEGRVVDLQFRKDSRKVFEPA